MVFKNDYLFVNHLNFSPRYVCHVDAAVVELPEVLELEDHLHGVAVGPADPAVRVGRLQDLEAIAQDVVGQLSHAVHQSSVEVFPVVRRVLEVAVARPLDLASWYRVPRNLLCNCQFEQTLL